MNSVPVSLCLLQSFFMNIWPWYNRPQSSKCVSNYDSGYIGLSYQSLVSELIVFISMILYWHSLLIILLQIHCIVDGKEFLFVLWNNFVIMCSYVSYMHVHLISLCRVTGYCQIGNSSKRVWSIVDPSFTDRRLVNWLTMCPSFWML